MKECPECVMSAQKEKSSAYKFAEWLNVTYRLKQRKQFPSKQTKPLRRIQVHKDPLKLFSLQI